MLTSAFGASIAHSMATAYGCAGTSSGRTRMGFWQLRTKSRVTVKTKSGLVSNILVTNWSVVCIVISGGLAIPRPSDLYWAGGLAAGGVAQVCRDAAILSLELRDRIKGRVAGEERNGRVQPSARKQ